MDNLSSSSVPSKNITPEDHLPLIEKYRPKEFKNIASHTELLSTLDNFITAGRLPHLLFHGPPGTGKTTTILAMARKMYGDQFTQMTLERNASDDRGIDTVRTEIKTFASTKSVFCRLPKLIILDECDAMVKEAQFALRRIVEKYSSNARFCLICNYVNRIIPALQSRCTKMRFCPLEPQTIFDRLKEISSLEGYTADDNALKSIVTLSGGDMRKALNTLQSVAMATMPSPLSQLSSLTSDASSTPANQKAAITVDAVYQTAGKPNPRMIEEFIYFAMNRPFEEAIEACWKLKEEGSHSLGDIISACHSRLVRISLPLIVKCTLLDKMAVISADASRAYNERLQFIGFISILQEAQIEGVKEGIRLTNQD
ncbi:Replication factor C subunit 5, RFC5 [Monocercomonoides exilis]|uniref:Replication factor C subunit 5, RFC5 n=1 Tax=Monocercomonoides exilis TaxID=2049356 RepID=UPI00355A0F2E|nr:Replication factor C subunit 5, RFC5 [Monocercomonoides exilis]|eukprot:MONOS_584.1-p1 / transcript=MONOS_584.1 / gene=MONOS_584 / organism=Monocercomonoides_exilis_PA203 / gene_product=Replication factor C subunit 5, RFC5 / transcript_product=Replication factor C subunit 5, RFC5 / location=Mono_scaffold00009:187705-189156(-) / protein_length=370 / sequence_SO=supercontig / SO=protein_coding / is_pseudo=false